MVELEGTVKKVLPNSVFKVQLANGQVIDGHVSGRVRLHYIRILAGDRVKVQISRYDLTKGRIVYRYK